MEDGDRGTRGTMSAQVLSEAEALGSGNSVEEGL